jgi:hypothetical protein
VPQSQHDPSAAVELLRRIAFNGVRIDQLAQDALHDGVSYPRGTWVVPMNQEFGELVRQLFEVQVYPDLREYPDGPPEQPYDAAGWTLPYQMDVRVIPALAPLSSEFRAAMRPVRADPGGRRDAADAPFESDEVAAGITFSPGRVTGSGANFSVDPAQTNAFRLIHRALGAGATVRFTEGKPGRRGEGGESGRYVIVGGKASGLQGWVSELGVQAERTSASGGGAVAARVALYKPWRASMDEGWTRWLFDQYDVKYTTVTNADFKAGDLGRRFDVIILASDPPQLLLEGYARGTVPARYEGGLGADGVSALAAFVRSGGTLVALNQSSDFAIQQLHLPVRNVLTGVPRREFFASGSILEVITDPAHPVMAGMPGRAKVFFDRSPAFTTLDGFEGAVLAKYAAQGNPLRSGYLLGEKFLQGHAAALDVKHGNGHVVLIGFRPQWRGQPFGTFRVVFNSAMFGRDVADRAVASPDFWKPPPAPAESRTVR